jgi:GxxExxY protein
MILFTKNKIGYMDMQETHLGSLIDNDLEENILSAKIIEASIEVHKVMGGPGLLESIYEEALYRELQLRGIEVKKQINVPVKYKGTTLRDPLRLDLIVENKIIIEIKATENDNSIYKTQLMTYLRLTNLKLGLLLNFGRYRLIDGITRLVNNF